MLFPHQFYDMLRCCILCYVISITLHVIIKPGGWKLRNLPWGVDSSCLDGWPEISHRSPKSGCWTNCSQFLIFEQNTMSCFLINISTIPICQKCSILFSADPVGDKYFTAHLAHHQYNYDMQSKWVPKNVPITIHPDCCLSQDVGKQVFGRFPKKCGFYTIHDAHKQNSLLDTIANYIFYVGPPRKTSILKSSNATICRPAKPANM